MICFCIALFPFLPVIQVIVPEDISLKVLDKPKQVEPHDETLAVENQEHFQTHAVHVHDSALHRPKHYCLFKRELRVATCEHQHLYRFLRYSVKRSNALFLWQPSRSQINGRATSTARRASLRVRTMSSSSVRRSVTYAHFADLQRGSKLRPGRGGGDRFTTRLSKTVPLTVAQPTRAITSFIK